MPSLDLTTHDAEPSSSSVRGCDEAKRNEIALIGGTRRASGGMDEKADKEHTTWEPPSSQLAVIQQDAAHASARGSAGVLGKRTHETSVIMHGTDEDGLPVTKRPTTRPPNLLSSMGKCPLSECSDVSLMVLFVNRSALERWWLPCHGDLCH